MAFCALESSSKRQHSYTDRSSSIQRHAALVVSLWIPPRRRRQLRGFISVQLDFGYFKILMWTTPTQASVSRGYNCSSPFCPPTQRRSVTLQMPAIGFKGHVSLDSWLFGEEKPTAVAPVRGSSASTASSSASAAAARSSSAPGNVARAGSMPVTHHFTLGRGKSAATPKAPTAAAAANARVPATPVPKGAAQTQSPSDPSYPFPVSAKLRKLFRPNRLQWNAKASRLSAAVKTRTMSAQEKRERLLGVSAASFQRLQGHVPFTLKEIVKDPKKLPFLLRWLSVDGSEEMVSTKTNYHHVLLFLLEIEQLQLVAEEKRRDQALKIWHKYIDKSSEFQISTTLELTPELEQLVRDNLDAQAKVLDAFFPIQKLAYMRLTREEMPRFLKSDEYLQMLIETENDLESVPMERILEQPRAAHYFLLFLMQSRQHFELYFWLHVEYVLKPLLQESEKNHALFWRLARVLMQKAQNDSQAITLATKNELLLAIEERQLDAKMQPAAAKAAFNKAQQEIFVMLRSSWFDRFMKSNLYKVALKDSRIQMERDESKSDSPPKLLQRFSTSDFASQRSLNVSADTEDSSESDKFEALVEQLQVDGKTGSSSRIREDLDSPSDESESSEGSSDEETDYANIMLNLESIIRLTNLPDGLQVHYRPNYDAPSTNLSELNEEEESALDAILTFATFVEKQEGSEAQATLSVMPIADPERPNEGAFEDLTRRVKAFLVPDGRVLIQRHSADEPRPKEVLFPFQQSGRTGFLFGSVYLKYVSVRVGVAREEMFAAKGICVLSRFPLVNTLRQMMETHITSSSDPSDVFDPERLAGLYHPQSGQERASFVASPMTADAQKLIKKHSSIVDLPLSVLESPLDVSMKPLFRHFGSAQVLQILASALLECSIVVVASQYTLLTVGAEAIRSLLRPFSWCHVYAPVLPQSLLSYLQCPTPILVGVHSEYATRADLPTSGFYLVADMDRNVIEYVGQQSVAWRRMGLQDEERENQIFLPRAFEDTKRDLDRILYAQRYECDSIGGMARDSELAFSDEHVRLACLDLFSGLLRGHTNACLVVGDTNESVVIFDETQFLSTRDLEDLPFYQTLMRSQCFSEIISAHRIDMGTKEIEGSIDSDTVTTGVV